MTHGEKVKPIILLLFPLFHGVVIRSADIITSLLKRIIPMMFTLIVLMFREVNQSKIRVQVAEVFSLCNVVTTTLSLGIHLWQGYLCWLQFISTFDAFLPQEEARRQGERGREERCFAMESHPYAKRRGQDSRTAADNPLDMHTNSDCMSD